MTSVVRARQWLRLTCWACLLAPCGCDAGSPGGPAPALEAPNWVGRDVCAECHEAQAELFEGSHHDLAMQPASGQTVLGNFADASVTHAGVTSTFFRREGKFMVRTDGPDGRPAEYRISHTFGVTPLQQYLVPLPGGRLQALAVGWDTRPKEAGGQRWFHLYPDDRIDHEDVLHWTGRYQNWNFMCAECHSTDVVKGYDAQKDAYHTTWREIDVSCEACHGPGSAHVAWARSVPGGDDPENGEFPGTAGKKGLFAGLHRLPDAAWVLDAELGRAERKGPLPDRRQVDTCARCHARRTPITETYTYGQPFLDTHRPALLTEPLYHADGQILDEVYVWGSFMQSRMHAQGVVCTDCHDPHSARLRAFGNALCYRCHRPEKYDVPAHHHHEQGTEAATCVACHMPARNYMVVDPRRDHSMRVPRPDLSLLLGTPNACNGCHQDESVAWAAAAALRLYGTKNIRQHYGVALHFGRQMKQGAVRLLLALARDSEQPGIARATALNLLPQNDPRAAAEAIAAAATDADDLVRMAAAEALMDLPLPLRARAGAALLRDGRRAVRIAAGRALAGVPAGQLMEQQSRARDRATSEYEAAQRTNAELPAAQVNLGGLWQDLGRLQDARAAYEKALALDVRFEGAWINLADLDRAQGDDAQAEQVLRKGLKRLPRSAGLHHSLGLTLVRLGRKPEALEHLRTALLASPENGRYAFVYAVALNSAGRPAEALQVLREALKRHPGAREARAFRDELVRRGVR